MLAGHFFFWEACLRYDFDYSVSGVRHIVRILIELGANPWIRIESGEVLSYTSQKGRNALRKQSSVEAVPKNQVDRPLSDCYNFID